MKLSPRTEILSAAIIATFLCFVFPMGSIDRASPQGTRVIKVLVPFPAGGSADILARQLGEQVGKMHGVTVLIENRPGAGTVIGTEAVARAAPDGNTLLLSSPSIIITPQLRRLNFDPLTSFEPICDLASFPTVIAVNSQSPYRSLADLFKGARARPGELTLGSLGPGSINHIGIERLKRAAQVNITFVPYPGTAPAVNALLGEHISSYLGAFTDVAALVGAGKLRAIAAATRTRNEALPNVPTIHEAGYNFDNDAWFGLFAPQNTPRSMVSQLASWFTLAGDDPNVKAKLMGQGLYPVGMCGVDFANLLRLQHDEYGRIIREANIKAE